MIKKILITVFVLISIAQGVMSQTPELDSLGDLWIITIDKSGSMLRWDDDGSYMLANRAIITENTLKRLNSAAFTMPDFSRSKFLFFNSGILKRMPDPSKLKLEGPLETSFIHYTDTLLHSFDNKDGFLAQIKTQMLAGEYSYDYSFVSQLKLFSIVKGMAFMKDRGLTASYDHIYLLMITDDADQNDQWMSDYKTVKKYAPDKLAEVNDTTTKYLYNPFNARSDISTSGKLIEKYADETIVPHISLDEYLTTQSEETYADSFAALSLHTKKDQGVDLTDINKTFGPDSILLFFIDSVTVNGAGYAVGKWFTDSLFLPVRLKNGLNHNQIAVKGYFQTAYNDSILGPHYKKYRFGLAQTFPSFLLGRVETDTKAGLLAALLGLLIYILWVAPRRRLYTLYDSLGKKLMIRKGSRLYGKFRSWAKGNNPIAAYCLDEKDELTATYRRHKSIGASYHGDGLHEHCIVINSAYPLSADRQNFQFEPFPPSVDLEEYHSVRDFNLLLRDLYSRSLNFRLFRLAGKYKMKHTAFFRALLALSNYFRPHYYYVLTLNNGDFKDHTLSFSCGKWSNCTFLIECCSNKEPLVPATENDRRIISCLNRFYTDETSVADALITVHCQNDKVDWNVIKLEYRNSLHKAFQVFHFQQTLSGAQGVDNRTLERNISILRRLSYLSAFHIGKCKVYVGGADGETDASEENRNIRRISLSRSTFQNFIYLAETKDAGGRVVKQLYSPFKEGMMEEKMTQTPVGSYHLFSSFAPLFIEKQYNEAFSRQIAENLFLFSTKRDMQLNFHREDQSLMYANHTIPLNDF